MKIFDLVFLACFVASVATLVTVVIFALRGRGGVALRIFRVWATCVLLYFVAALAMDYWTPQRRIAVGAPWCFDDWCIQVENIHRTPLGRTIAYDVEFRIYSTARGISQRANGAWIYLLDEQGHRYPARTNPSETPLTVLLGPGEQVTTSRVFEVPADARGLGLITGHGGPYCGAMSLLIIGDGGCLFNRPAIVPVEP